MAAQGIIDKKGHKRDIRPFLPTLHWARIKYCGRSQGGSNDPVVTLCGCPGHYRGKGTYVPFVPFGQLCLGQTKTGKNDLSRVQSACGDVLKMTGAMPGKRDIKWPIYVPFMSGLA